MCGRFTIDIDERFYPRFKLSGKPVLNFIPRYNLAPGQESIVITRHGDENLSEFMRWGLVPSWAKDEKVGYKMINAKAETLLEKPSYRHAARKQRCLVPATGFYEWQLTDNASKQPKYIYNPEEKYLALAGLYEWWKDPASGKELETFTIVTTEPNTFMKPIHDRMPLILNQESEQLWLAPDTDVNTLELILHSIPEVQLTAYDVSAAVNSPKNDSRELIRRV